MSHFCNHFRLLRPCCTRVLLKPPRMICGITYTLLNVLVAALVGKVSIYHRLHLHFSGGSCKTSEPCECDKPTQGRTHGRYPDVRKSSMCGAMELWLCTHAPASKKCGSRWSDVKQVTAFRAAMTRFGTRSGCIKWPTMPAHGLLWR